MTLSFQYLEPIFTIKTIQLGRSDLHVTPICLGTMTFGEQVDEHTAHAIMDRAVERGINFLDTAEMYAVPPKAETYNATEKIVATGWPLARHALGAGWQGRFVGSGHHHCV